jgi:heptosyltransferase-2
VVQVAGIGDLVLTTPALDSLRERFPDARIGLLTSPRSARLLEAHSAVDQVHSFDILRFRNPLALLRPSARALLRAQLRPVRAARYDALLSMNNVASGRGGFSLGLTLRALQIPLWVGRNTNGRAPYFDLALQEDERDPVPEAVTKLRVAGLLGASAAPRPASLPVKREDREMAAELLGEGDWAAVLPGANVPAKRWPLVRFGEIARRLVERRGFRLAVLGGQEDARAAEVVELSGGEENALRLDGRLDLGQAAAVLERCRIAVTNDTGPMHMAAALGTPLVAVFASANLARYRPWGDARKLRTLTGDAGELDPATREGMRASVLGVRVDEVWEAVEELLGPLERAE